ncbi:developmentally regulated GTP-binding protein 2-like protein [Vairimorpha necatrix]|uniref:Developmentally regulated GTP-binding protein 2-like protein n=1 Tax=Vairimorpha necatrix TaxID=6039 RepID=A0AAX4JDL6_9MICR
MGIQDKINEIEAEMARTQKNKKTEYHIGTLKARLARYKHELDNPKTTNIKSDGWEVAKSGDARIALIGFPSVGKSTLLSKITNTESKAAEDEFTTLDCIAGKLEYNGSTIQILDLPGIISGASSNLGRGKQVISICRTADLILIVLDPRRKHDKKVLIRELFNMGIRLNKKRPDVSINLTTNGGICINKQCDLTQTSEEAITAILKEYKINHCNILIKEDVSTDDIVDLLSKNVSYIKCLFCYNKTDELSYEDFKNLSLEENTILISCKNDWNINELKEYVWEKLNLTRIYTKKKGEMPDFNRPIVLRDNLSVFDLCGNIHKDFYSDFKYALVWGRSAKHSPQKVGLNHVLEDEDVIQICLK